MVQMERRLARSVKRLLTINQGSVGSTPTRPT